MTKKRRNERQAQRQREISKAQHELKRRAKRAERRHVETQPHIEGRHPTIRIPLAARARMIEDELENL